MISKQNWNFHNTYTKLPPFFFSRVNPTPVKNPHLILFNKPLAHQIGLNFESVSNENLAQMFSGNSLPLGAEPLAQAYAGHQFGNFTNLGDGRAILLGEHLSPDHKLWDIQLKGAGKTPYSRGGDGRAALAPMLREYLISEAMFHLGIPTTRSLAVVSTGELVVRESLLPGAILTRVASSHLRVGTFEWIAQQENQDHLKSLTNYAIQRFYPDRTTDPNPALTLLQLSIEQQAHLIVEWLRVGFIHGVMNTDNMSLSGETIDYGPCAFLNTYNSRQVFSSIDRNGRYSFFQQPNIALWNLTRFAEALIPILDNNEDKAIELASKSLNQFNSLFKSLWLSMMRSKLGIFNAEDDDLILAQNLLNGMELNKMDFTNTFQELSKILMNFNNESNSLPPSLNNDNLIRWIKNWFLRLKRQPQSALDSITLMQSKNPTYIPRNHLVEKALFHASVENDLNYFNRFLNALKTPYQEQPNSVEFQEVPPHGYDDQYHTFCGT